MKRRKFCKGTAQATIKALRSMGYLSGGRKSKHRKGRRHKSGRKLSPGVHRVNIRGKSRKVRVLNNGRWRFMKG